MNIATRYVSRDYLRNGKLNLQSGSISNSGSSSYGGLTGNYLPAISNGDGTYTVDLTNVTFNGNIVATGEVSAYGAGESSGTTGSVTVYDGLDSTDASVALSANQGRVLKEMITNLDIGEIDLSGYYSKEDIDNLIKGYSKTDHTHTIANITDLQTKLDTFALKSDLTTHTGNNTIHITADERTKWNTASTNSHTHTNKAVLDGITSTKITSWDNTNTNFNDWFYKDSSGQIHSKYTFIGDSEISAFGAGSSSSSGNVTVYDGLDSTSTDIALSANQGRILKSLIDNIDVGDIDLTGYYSKTEIDNKLSAKADSTHSHTFASLTSKPTTLAGYGITDAASKTHTHNYLSTSGGTIEGTLVIKRDASAIKYTNAAGDTVRGWLGFSEDGAASIWASDGSTKYTILHSNNYSSYSPTLTAFNTHKNDTTAHITSTERTNWNTAYNNRHTHSNKTVLDGITSTKVSNWDTVYSNWNKVFTIDSNGDLKVKVNVIGEKEISAYGAGTSTSGGGSITIVDGLTSTATDAALSANQGRVLKNLIDNLDLSQYVTDLSNYYTKTQVDDLLDDIKPTWSNISGKPTFATVATSGSYNDLSNKPTIPTNTNQLTNGAGYITGITKSMVTTALGYTPPTTNTTYSAGTGLKLSGTTFSADGSAIINSLGEGTSPAERTDYIVAQYAGGGTTTTSYHRRSLANVFAALTKSDITTALGYTPPTTNTTYSAGTGLSLSGTSFSVKYGTAAGTACQGNDSRLSDSRPASDVYSWAKASSKPSYSWSEITSKPTFATVATSGKYSDLSGKPTIPTNNNQLTNGAGYITSSGSISGNAATATKLATARTLWGQSFNGTANVGGTITGSYFKINDTSTNPYLQLTQGSTWYIQGYSGYLYLGAGSTKSLRIDSSGNCLAVGEVTAHSDKRLKTDIRPLEIRGELNPVTYVKDGKESIGFIADEVKKVYPELVVTDESTDEKYLSLNYAQLTAVLYAEIKELKNQIRELNEKVRTMAN